MQLGMVGLGRMGGNMRERLVIAALRNEFGGHTVKTQ